jgi:hypothetical protein
MTFISRMYFLVIATALLATGGRLMIDRGSAESFHGSLEWFSNLLYRPAPVLAPPATEQGAPAITILPDNK